MALSDVRLTKEWNAYPPNGTFGSFDANYDRYVFGDAQGVVHVARVADGTEIGQFAGYEPPYDSLEFSPDGRFLFVACGPGHTRVEVVDLKRKEVFLRLPQLKFRAVDFSADSRLVAISYDQPNSNYPVRVFDLTLRKEVRSFDHGSLPYIISFHPKQSNLLLTSDENPTVRVWDVAEGRVVQSFTHPDGVQGICWHPDGHMLATVTYNDFSGSKACAQGTGGPRLGGSDFPIEPAAAVSFMAGQYERYPLGTALRRAIDRGSAETLMPRLRSGAARPRHLARS